MAQDTRARLRERLAEDEIIPFPALHDALTAKMAEMAGYDVAWVGGYNVSVARLGLPDAGYITMPEMVQQCRDVANAVDIPILGDFDTGYGNAINARRTTQEAINHTQLAGIVIEDQFAPKRCGHVAGKQIISREEAIGKYRAAADVRDELDEDFVILARTDAVGVEEGGIDEAIERSNLYHEAGADIVWVEAPTSMEQIERIPEEVTGPYLMHNNLYYGEGVSPFVPRDDLEDLGYDIVNYFASLLPTMTSFYDYLVGIMERDTEYEQEFQESIADHPLSDLHAFAGFDRVRELEEKFLPEEEQEKYHRSIGHQP